MRYLITIILLVFSQDYIIQHNQQYVIELDANLSPKQLFRVRMDNVHV